MWNKKQVLVYIEIGGNKRCFEGEFALNMSHLAICKTYEIGKQNE